VYGTADIEANVPKCVRLSEVVGVPFGATHGCELLQRKLFAVKKSINTFIVNVPCVLVTAPGKWINPVEPVAVGTSWFVSIGAFSVALADALGAADADVDSAGGRTRVRRRRGVVADVEAEAVGAALALSVVEALGSGAGPLTCALARLANQGATLASIATEPTRMIPKRDMICLRTENRMSCVPETDCDLQT
jgi:hypothetical protein